MIEPLDNASHSSLATSSIRMESPIIKSLWRHPYIRELLVNYPLIIDLIKRVDEDLRGYSYQFFRKRIYDMEKFYGKDVFLSNEVAKLYACDILNGATDWGVRRIKDLYKLENHPHLASYVLELSDLCQNREEEEESARGALIADWTTYDFREWAFNTELDSDSMIRAWAMTSYSYYCDLRVKAENRDFPIDERTKEFIFKWPRIETVYFAICYQLEQAGLSKGRVVQKVNKYITENNLYAIQNKYQEWEALALLTRPIVDYLFSPKKTESKFAKNLSKVETHFKKYIPDFTWTKNLYCKQGYILYLLLNELQKEDLSRVVNSDQTWKFSYNQFLDLKKLSYLNI